MINDSGKYLMMKICFLLLLPCFVSAQDSLFQADIDKQIWIPFAASYASFDAETFNSIHSDDMIRISSTQIRDAHTYKEGNTKWFAKSKDSGMTRSIEFKFDNRVANDSIAHETGYYKVTNIDSNQIQNHYYARFHVVLKKEMDTWKIVQDWDSDILNGIKVTEADFNK